MIQLDTILESPEIKAYFKTLENKRRVIDRLVSNLRRFNSIQILPSRRYDDRVHVKNVPLGGLVKALQQSGYTVEGSKITKGTSVFEIEGRRIFTIRAISA